MVKKENNNKRRKALTEKNIKKNIKDINNATKDEMEEINKEFWQEIEKDLNNS